MLMNMIRCIESNCMVILTIKSVADFFVLKGRWRACLYIQFIFYYYKWVCCGFWLESAVYHCANNKKTCSGPALPVEVMQPCALRLCQKRKVWGRESGACSLGITPWVQDYSRGGTWFHPDTAPIHDLASACPVNIVKPWALWTNFITILLSLANLVQILVRCFVNYTTLLLPGWITDCSSKDFKVRL